LAFLKFALSKVEVKLFEVFGFDGSIELEVNRKAEGIEHGFDPPVGDPHGEMREVRVEHQWRIFNVGE
jgi:hypothetical protein